MYVLPNAPPQPLLVGSGIVFFAAIHNTFYLRAERRHGQPPERSEGTWNG